MAQRGSQRLAGACDELTFLVRKKNGCIKCVLDSRYSPCQLAKVRLAPTSAARLIQASWSGANGNSSAGVLQEPAIKGSLPSAKCLFSRTLAANGHSFPKCYDHGGPRLYYGVQKKVSSAIQTNLTTPQIISPPPPQPKSSQKSQQKSRARPEQIGSLIRTMG